MLRGEQKALPFGGPRTSETAWPLPPTVWANGRLMSPNSQNSNIAQFNSFSTLVALKKKLKQTKKQNY